MGTFNDFMDMIVHYIGIGWDFILSYALTVEGLITLIIATFVFGFFSQIRS